jgi:hypothetical protein
VFVAGLPSGEVEVEAAGQPTAAGTTLLASLAATRAAGGQVTRFRGSAARDVARQRPVLDLRAARGIADGLADALERELPDAAPSVIRAIRFAAEELGANIVQHSGAPGTGFVAVSTDARLGRLQLAAADAGAGFLASLQRYPELAGRVADDGEALQLDVEKGLSGVGGRTNMGMGRGVRCDLSDRLDAALWIASGQALWHRRTVASGARVATVRPLAVPLRGSWVCFDGPNRPGRAA